MTQKQQLSILDIAVLVQELQRLKDSKIENIYGTDEIFWIRLKIRTEGKAIERTDLLIEPGRRVHFTEYRREAPPTPPEKILHFRRLLKGRKITSLEQWGRDRMLLLRATDQNGSLEVYIELFGRKGNVVVVDETTRLVKYARWYRKMRDRDLLPGKPFELPPAPEKSILDLEPEDLTDFRMETDPNQDIVRGLISVYRSGGELTEEILARANIPKTCPIKDMKEENWSKLYEELIELREQMKRSNPVIITSTEGKFISVLPFPFVSIPGSIQYHETFNLALDTYFMEVLPQVTISLTDRDQKLRQLQRKLDKQLNHVEDLRIQAQKYRKYGDLIYENYSLLEEIFSSISNARTSNVSWEEILEKF